MVADIEIKLNRTESADFLVKAAKDVDIVLIFFDFDKSPFLHCQSRLRNSEPHHSQMSRRRIKTFDVFLFIFFFRKRKLNFNYLIPIQIVQEKHFLHNKNSLFILKRQVGLHKI